MDKDLDASQAEKFARLALAGVHREYPNQPQHLLTGKGDIASPQALHPVFYGCFDWHSAVHSHWMLVRLLRHPIEITLQEEIVKALSISFTPAKILVEARYFSSEERNSFERPYGWAWLLQLMTELREWQDDLAGKWLACLQPLEAIVVERLGAWLPKLRYPVRSGTHSQTAFALSLCLDWARTASDRGMEELIVGRTLQFHENDVASPLHYEPSGEDFLSPSLMEADLMRRVLAREAFAEWLAAFLPQIPTDGAPDWLAVGKVMDETDGRLVHLHGLNLSRAWNMESIALALPEDDARVAALRACAERHKQAGLEAFAGEHYASTHWLASFAVYLLTRRGCEGSAFVR